MPPFNGRQLQQQLRAFLVFIQLHIMMYLLFLRRPQQPPPPAPIQRSKRRHNMWVRPWLLQREERRAYHNIMAELYATDIPGFTNIMRMTPEFFEMIKTRLEPHLARQATVNIGGLLLSLRTLDSRCSVSVVEPRDSSCLLVFGLASNPELLLTPFSPMWVLRKPICW